MSVLEKITDEAPFYGIGQHPDELARARDLYFAEKPRRVLEIGVWHGGTLREWLTHAQPKAVVVAVDPSHENPDKYDEWKKPDTTLIVIVGHSQDNHIAREIKNAGPYDWVFIDGDHSDAGVSADVELALSELRPGGLILLHDIVADGYPETGPRMVLNRLRGEGFEIDEIVEPLPDWFPPNLGHGIGVIHAPKAK